MFLLIQENTKIILKFQYNFITRKHNICQQLLNMSTNTRRKKKCLNVTCHFRHIRRFVQTMMNHFWFSFSQATNNNILHYVQILRLMFFQMMKMNVTKLNDLYEIV
jgi:hypothetical protein